MTCPTCAGSAVYDGHITAPETGDYQLALTGFGDATLSIDGQQVATMSGATGRRAYGATPTGTGSRAAPTRFTSPSRATMRSTP